MKIFVMFLFGVLSAGAIAHTGHDVESGVVHNAVHLLWLVLACGSLSLVLWYVRKRRNVR